MCHIRLPALGFFLTMIALTLVGCDKRPTISPANASAAASAVSATVALPNFTALVKKEGPAVINISTTRKVRGVLPFPALPGLTPDDPFYEFFRRFAPGDQMPREFRSQSLGSGFIISADGHILTNAHVIEDAEEVTVRLTDGTVRRGRLGVSIQGVTPEYARSFDLAKPGGALIASVDKDGPADRAGLEIGDIILKFDGKELASADDLVRAVAEGSPGSSAKLQVWRNGAAREITVKLGEAESKQMVQKQSLPDKAAEPGQLGLNLRELSRDERSALHTAGYLLVAAVEGVAAESGIQPGDITIAVNSQRFSSVRQLRAELPKVGKHAAMLVQRQGNMIFIPLKFQDERAFSG